MAFVDTYGPGAVYRHPVGVGIIEAVLRNVFIGYHAGHAASLKVAGRDLRPPHF